MHTPTKKKLEKYLVNRYCANSLNSVGDSYVKNNFFDYNSSFCAQSDQAGRGQSH